MLTSSLDDREWDERVAREVDHQASIEAAYDRADACERMGDLEQALEWLETAELLSGGLAPAYVALRVRWAHEPAQRGLAAAGAHRP